MEGETFEAEVSKSFNSSLSDLSIGSKMDMVNSDEQEEEDLLAACISSAIPKSVSMLPCGLERMNKDMQLILYSPGIWVILGKDLLATCISLAIPKSVQLRPNK